MQVIKDVEMKKNHILDVGDVIEHNESGDFYLITHEVDTYIAKNFNGRTGAFGRFDSMRALQERFDAKLDKYTVYKKNEFHLLIQAKK